MKIIKNKKYNKALAEVVKDSPMKIKLGPIDKLSKDINPASTIAVHLKLLNGNEEFHTKVVTKGRIKVYNRSYFVDPKYLIYNRTFKMFMATYHQNVSLPIKTIINVDEIKRALDNNAKYINVKSNLNPEILTAYAKTKVIEGALQGQALTNTMGFLKVVSIVNAFISLGCLLLLFQVSGIFGG